MTISYRFNVNMVKELEKFSLKANLHAAICRADLSATTNRGANRRV